MPREEAREAASQMPRGAPAFGVFYTCPRHPQVRSSVPGTCPICGMELIPKEAKGDE